MKQDKWYVRYRAVLIILLLLVVLLLLPGTHSSRAAARQPEPEVPAVPTDSLQADQKDLSSVDYDKLKQYITAATAPPAPVPVDTTNMDNQINTIIADNADITFGVSIKDVNTGAFYNYGYLDAMTCASVSKVLTAVDYYKQVELGLRSLDTVMVNGNTAQYNIEQMIVVSDNDAWHTLNDDLTYPQIQEYARSIGINSYLWNGNVMSSSDTALLFADLYERKLISEPNTQQLLAYMEIANFRDLIIPAVPPHDTVYHKAGWYSAYLNDAAIITNATNTIVVSIYTDSNTTYYDKARVAPLMQQITTAALQTFKLN